MMSAFVVDRYHIVYLVKAAREAAIRLRSPLRWGDGHTLDASVSVTEMVALAQLLWDENRSSVSYRYDALVGLPGPIDEDYIIRAGDFQRFSWVNWSPVDVLKAIDCYQYQSCEHPGWQTSEAKAFTDALRRAWTHLVPGYDEAPWGAPRPMDHIEVER
jgi:hypothetical protein